MKYLTLTLGIAGLAILIYDLGVLACIGLYLFLWSNNISITNKLNK
jgi:hypothetical protein